VNRSALDDEIELLGPALGGHCKNDKREKTEFHCAIQRAVVLDVDPKEGGIGGSPMGHRPVADATTLRSLRRFRASAGGKCSRAAVVAAPGIPETSADRKDVSRRRSSRP